MTLHEQYKEDTEPHPFLKNKGHVKILMKKAYLNSIDCMIEHEYKNNGERAYCNYESYVCSVCKLDVNKGSGMCNFNYPTDTGDYLKQQRDLIANEL